MLNEVRVEEKFIKPILQVLTILSKFFAMYMQYRYYMEAFILANGAIGLAADEAGFSRFAHVQYAISPNEAATRAEF